MARAITISKATSTIYVILPAHMESIKSEEIDGTDVSYTDSFVANGNISMARAQKKAETHYHTRNVMAVYVVSGVSDDAKLTLDGNTFLAKSHVCEDGITYGHEYVTREIKSTKYTYMALVDEKPVNGTDKYPDVTTASKLLNYARRMFGAGTIVLTSEIVTERRYMLVSEFEKLAK